MENKTTTYIVRGTHPDGRTRRIGPFWSIAEAILEALNQRASSPGWTFIVV